MKGILKDILICMLVIFFIGASIFPIISGQGETYFYANQDIPVQNGGISGSYLNTQSSDDSYEGISETENGGKPSKRYSYLEHKWTFSLSGSFNTLNFYIEAYHSANSEGDDFVFAYSTNDAGYYDILTVSKTSDDDNYQSAELPNTLSGTVYIRVRDSDRSQGNRVLDTIFIDHMYIVGDSGPDVTPPVISDVASDYNEYTWYNMTPNFVGGIPPQREKHSMAFDSNAGCAIMFGGGGAQNMPNEERTDTWAYNFANNTWFNRSVSSGPSGRLDAAMAYDSESDKTILFGGLGFQRKFKETWAYDFSTNTWTNMTSLPTYREVGGELYTRSEHAMVYDSHADRIIMFGGNDQLPGLCKDTWAYNYNNNTWYNMNPTIIGGMQTNGIYRNAMAYDEANQCTVLFGGHATNDVPYIDLRDTYVYDYNTNTWTNKTPTMNIVGGDLEPRFWHSMCYDSEAERCVMFGGCQFPFDGWFDDTWMYDVPENTWYNIDFNDVGGNLIGREETALVYDSINKRSIMFGGWNTDPVPPGDYGYLNETWTFKINDPAVKITWTTDEPSDSVVNYGNTTALGLTVSDSTLVTEHQIAITEVIPDITYYFEVQSTDEAENTAVDDNNGNYYTVFTGQDTTPPVITNVQSSGITHNSATITWNTDESSNSRVNYGNSTYLGNTEFNPAMVTSHSIVLSDLLSETTYYYEVESTDGEGNTATDDNNGSYYTFTTESEPNNNMHVYSIDMWYTQDKNKVTIYSRVKIVDAGDNAVEGATVDIDLATPNNGIIPMSDVTDLNGEVTFTYGPTPKTGTYTTTVTDVTKSGWIYNSGDNVETSDQLTVPPLR